MADMDFTKTIITGSHAARMGTLNALIDLFKHFRAIPAGADFSAKSKSAIQSQIQQMFKGVMSGNISLDKANRFLHQAVNSLIKTRQQVNLSPSRSQIKFTSPGLRAISPETASVYQPTKRTFVEKVQPTTHLPKQEIPFKPFEASIAKKDLASGKNVAKTPESAEKRVIEFLKKTTPTLKDKEIAEILRKTAPAPTDKSKQTKTKGGASGGEKTEKASTFGLGTLWENISKGLGTYKWGILGLLAGLLLMSFLRRR